MLHWLWHVKVFRQSTTFALVKTRYLTVTQEILIRGEKGVKATEALGVIRVCSRIWPELFS